MYILRLRWLAIAWLLICGSILIGCKETPTGNEDEVCSLPPSGTGVSAEPDSAFVWRLCNTSTAYPMDSLTMVAGSNWFTRPRAPLDVGLVTLQPCTCSEDYSSNRPLDVVGYFQDGKRQIIIELARKRVHRGLLDSSRVYEAPGRYTYHFHYTVDARLHPSAWASVEIEREAYHSQD